MYALTHCRLYTGDQELSHQALIIEGDRILDIVPQAQIGTDLPTLDGQGLSAAPGLIDLQLNGCGGVMVNDAITAATLDTMHRTNLKSGTTSFLPTLITSPDADMIAAMELVQTYRQTHPYPVLGLHLEGPYLNPERRGIHNLAQIRPADLTTVKAIAAAGPEVVRLITLAPEMVPPTMITILAEAGIVVSAGHSNASYEEALAGFAAGITMVTHLFNAMSPWQGRHPGLVGATFSADPVYAGIIADGHHVHFGSICLAHRLKPERLLLVTDATPPVGTQTDSFIIGGQRVFYRDGKCISADGTLGGSALTLIEAVANSVTQLHLPLAEALRMASLYPARAIGVDHHLGRLAPGYVANLVLLDPQTQTVRGVIDRGQAHWFEPDPVHQPAASSGFQ